MSLPLLTRIRNAADALLGRSIEAGGSGRRWPAGSALRNVPSAIRGAAEPAAARAAHYALNNPYGAQIPEILASSLIGEDGPRPLSRLENRDIARDLDRRWRKFERRCGLNGENLADLMRQAVSGWAVNGEAFVHMRVDASDQLRLVLLDPEQVDRSKTTELQGGGKIIQGVELDPDGRVVGYHIFPNPPGDPYTRYSLQTVFVAAAEVLHLYKPIAAGQVRGLSQFSSILTRLAEIDAIEDAQLARIKVAALFAGFITDQGDTAADMADQGDTDTGLEPGILKVLKPGQGIEFTSALPQAGDAMDFLKSQLRAVAAGTGITYQQLTGDLSDTNYSSIRAGLLEHRRRMGALQRQILEPRVLDLLWRRFVMLEVLTGRIAAPDFESDPEAYYDCDWMWPAWPAVDPVKEINASVAAIESGLKSRREVISADGRDPEAIQADIDRERELYVPGPAPKPAPQHGAAA